jgi:hypothetical protein
MRDSSNRRAKGDAGVLRHSGPFIFEPAAGQPPVQIAPLIARTDSKESCAASQIVCLIDASNWNQMKEVILTLDAK